MSNTLLQEIVDIVRQAGLLIRDAHHIEKDTKEKTCASDLVTKYDIAVQAFLQGKLLPLVPGSSFYGEEGDHGVVSGDWVFVVDPIDGTTNFVREMKYSNISVALVHHGHTEYGVVYNPFTDEMFAAQKGFGATLNGLPIHVSDHDSDHGLVLSGSTIYDRQFTNTTFSVLRQLYDMGQDFRRLGAAALDLCYVAAGRAEIYFECRLSPWDFAAGSLILTEAGGYISHLSGSPIDVLHVGSVFATNEACRNIRSQLHLEDFHEPKL